MKHFNEQLKQAHAELGISNHIPLSHLNSPSVFELSNGVMGVVIAVSGIPFEVVDQHVLLQYQQQWHQALMALDHRFAVYVTTMHQNADVQLSGEFDNVFLTELDRKYHHAIQKNKLYQNSIYITLIHRGVTRNKVTKSFKLFRWLTLKTIQASREAIRITHQEILERKTKQLCRMLHEFSPHILGSKDEVLGYSELIDFLSKVMHAGEGWQQTFVSHVPLLEKNLSLLKKMKTLYPFGNLGKYLARKHLFFGDYIQIQGSESHEKKFAAVLTIKNYCEKTHALMLSSLLRMDFEWINTHSFFVEGKEHVSEKIKRQLMRFKNVGDEGRSQHHALQDAQDHVASDRLYMGYHHNTLLIISNTKESLENKIARCVRCYADAGMIAVRENLGQEPAYWSQFPGNFNYITRLSLITSENFSDFTSLHNYRQGFYDHNHLGSAVTLLETSARTAYFFNYHVSGFNNNPSKGHAIVIGGNNAGKTVFLTFMDAQMSRYKGRTFYFDRDRSAEIYIKACGGEYLKLSPNHAKDIAFAPFSLPDTPENRQFVRDLLARMCCCSAHDVISASELEQLQECVHYAYDQLKPEVRTLSNATHILPVSFSKWPSLRQWLRGNDQYDDGEYAYLFDHAEEKCYAASKIGFDMTHFLDHEPSCVRTVLMMYLFYQIEQRLNGSLVSIVLDEGWQYFIDDYWQEKLRRWLPTLRKKNVHIVIATQSISSILESPIKSTILDNIATQIYFPNPKADASQYIQGLNLSTAEFKFIQTHHPSSRLFLVKQEHESLLCRLDLSAIKAYLPVLSGNERNIRILNKILHNPSVSPEHWLPEFISQCS